MGTRVEEGRPAVNEDYPRIEMFKVPVYKWRLKPFADCPDLAVHCQRAPNAFYRVMQRLILGFKWERIEP